MAKYNIGDPVWCRATIHALSPGEHAGIILAAPHTTAFGPMYPVSLVQYSTIVNSDYWEFTEDELRPRRDDYQQHEGLGSRADIDNLIHYNDTVEA